MRSMTGFGRASAPCDGYELAVQISSVNRRGIEIVVSLPDEWRELEAAIAERIRGKTARGRVTAAVTVRLPEGRAESLADDATVGRTLDHLGALAHQRGLAFSPSAELLWSIASGLRNTQSLPAAEAVAPRMLALVDEALAAFIAMRETEGATLLADFRQRVALMRTHLAGVAERAPVVPAAYRENLLRRLRDAGLALDVSDERVLKEIALFADRCDITEEITRARSHLDQMDELLGSAGEIGRKAEFILQELGREINTTGSKANDLGIARLVIEAKNELERLREQIANVE